MLVQIGESVKPIEAGLGMGVFPCSIAVSGWPATVPAVIAISPISLIRSADMPVGQAMLQGPRVNVVAGAQRHGARMLQENVNFHILWKARLTLNSNYDQNHALVHQ